MKALLSVADIADLRGVDYANAWRYMRALERKGARLVKERGKLHISSDDYARFAAQTEFAREFARLRERLDAMEEALKLTDLRYETLRRDVDRLKSGALR